MTSPQKIQPAASSGCSIPNVGAGEPGPPVGKAFPGESGSWHRIPRILVLMRCSHVPAAATGARVLPGHRAPQQRHHSDRASSRTFLWQQSRVWQWLDKAQPSAACIPCCWHCCQAGPGAAGAPRAARGSGWLYPVPTAPTAAGRAVLSPSRWCPGAWGAARGAKAPQQAEGTLPGSRSSSPSRMPPLSSGRETLG